jgi:hypothetical protein
MDTGLLSTEHTTGVRPELPAQRDVVLPLAGTRQQRVATAASRTGQRKASLRLRAIAHPANSRGVEGRPQSSSPAVQAGGSPGTYESASPQAHQLASRPGSGGHSYRIREIPVTGNLVHRRNNVLIGQRVVGLQRTAGATCRLASAPQNFLPLANWSWTKSMAQY